MRPMTTPYAPQTALPPSPLTVGQAMGATLEILKRRFGFFVALALVPGLLVAVILVVAIAVGSGLMAAALWGLGYGSDPSGGQLAGSIAAGGLVLLLGFLAAMAVQFKANGLITLLAHETALGRRPDYAALNAGTRGIVGRSLVLILAAAGVGILLSFLFLAPLAGFATSGSRAGNDALAGALAFTFLLSLALGIGSIYLSTRWLYYNQALAVEGRGGIASLGSSWRLTRDNFWRTLGWYLLATATLSVALWVIGALFAALAGGLTSSRSSFTSGAGVALSLVYIVFLALVEALIVPTMMAYTTVMYIDQQRRRQLPAGGAPLRWAPQPGFPQQPGYPQQPGHPQAGYPQPGYPQPGFPQQPGFPPQQPGYPQQPGGQAPRPQYGYGPAPTDPPAAPREPNWPA